MMHKKICINNYFSYIKQMFSQNERIEGGVNNFSRPVNSKL